MPAPAGEGLHGGLVLEQGHHDLAVIGILLPVDHYQVPGQDAGTQHRLPPHPQGKVLPGHALGVEGEVVLDALLGQDRGPGGHVAQDGDLVLSGVGLLGHCPQGHGGDGDGPGLAFGLDDDAGLLQPLHVKVDGGGGLQSHRRTDLPHRGGIAVLGGEGEDIVIDLLLLRGELDHQAALLSTRDRDVKLSVSYICTVVKQTFEMDRCAGKSGQRHEAADRCTNFSYATRFNAQTMSMNSFMSSTY